MCSLARSKKGRGRGGEKGEGGGKEFLTKNQVKPSIYWHFDCQSG